MFHATLKSATKLFSVLLASKRPLITELADKLRLKRINLYLNRPNRRFILKNRFSKWYFGKHKVQLHPFQHSFSSLQW